MGISSRRLYTSLGESVVDSVQRACRRFVRPRASMSMTQAGVVTRHRWGSRSMVGSWSTTG